MKRKIASIILAVIMIFCTVAFNGSAVFANGIDGNEVEINKTIEKIDGLDINNPYFLEKLSLLKTNNSGIDSNLDYESDTVILEAFGASGNAVLHYVDNTEEEKTQTVFSVLDNTASVLTDGWYYVDKNLTVNNVITVSGNVKIVLKDGITFKAKQGIVVNSGNSLTVYAQSSGNGMGQLIAEGNKGCAAIGGDFDTADAGTVIIYGGIITAIGGAGAAGIGDGFCGNGSVVRIYNGIITAIAGAGATGIGSAFNGKRGTLTIDDRLRIKSGADANSLTDNKIGNNPYIVISPASEEAGDLNNDGYIDEQDMDAAVDILLSGDNSTDYDVNGDGVFDVLDYIRIKLLYENTAEKEYSEYTYTTGQTHKTFSESGRYFYNTLNENDKLIYKKIDAAVKNFETSVYIGEELKESYKYTIYYMYMFDHPECFYLCNSFGFYGSNKGLVILYSYERGKDSLEGSSTLIPMSNEFKTELQKKITEFNIAVDAIVSTIPSRAPDVVKEKLIYDYIIKNCDYNYDETLMFDGLADDNWTAYGGIVNRLGVCEAYSEAFQLLCYRVGINCTIMMYDSASESHMWNAVELDGEWYACDATFDDPVYEDPTYADPNYIGHDYFNVTDSDLEKLNHPFTFSYYPAPECTGTKYSYKNCFE